MYMTQITSSYSGYHVYTSRVNISLFTSFCLKYDDIRPGGGNTRLICFLACQHFVNFVRPKSALVFYLLLNLLLNLLLVEYSAEEALVIFIRTDSEDFIDFATVTFLSTFLSDPPSRPPPINVSVQN